MIFTGPIVDSSILKTANHNQSSLPNEIMTVLCKTSIFTTLILTKNRIRRGRLFLLQVIILTKQMFQKAGKLMMCVIALLFIVDADWKGAKTSLYADFLNDTLNHASHFPALIRFVRKMIHDL